jgi:eukaryotic-like serine/threonine-protein kinase
MTKDLVGKTLGEYNLESVIGEGGLATVYRAYQISLNRPVAIKVLYHQEGTSLARFQREAKVIAALRHRNILIIYEYGEQEGLPYIVMEYVEGGTLEDRLKGEPMDWRRVVNLIMPIAEALQYAHARGIIHRDVKPSNILMQQEDWPVLADFGLVKQSDEQQGLTMTGTFMGTPNYISPEQARDLPVDHRADMYSLGVVLFEMVAGRLPFNYKVSNKILLAHVMEEPPSPLTFNPNCPPDLAEIILKTLRKSPDERYANMQALIEALKTLLYGPSLPIEAPIEAQTAETDTPVAPIPTPAKVAPEEKSLGRFFKPIRNFFSREVPDELASQANVASGEEDEADHTVRLGSERAPASSVPKLVGGTKKITIEFPEGLRLVVGRTHGSTVVDINLEPHEASKYGVSRSHARFFKRENLWFLEDLHSLNGTFVNEVRLQHGQPAALKNGDTIRFSQMSFTFLIA